MPIEVRELVIRATVEDLSAGAQNSNGAGGSSQIAVNDAQLQSIIEECTQAVLKIIERQKTR